MAYEGLTLQALTIHRMTKYGHGHVTRKTRSPGHNTSGEYFKLFEVSSYKNLILFKSNKGLLVLFTPSLSNITFIFSQFSK